LLTNGLICEAFPPPPPPPPPPPSVTPSSVSQTSLCLSLSPISESVTTSVTSNSKVQHLQTQAEKMKSV
jgi:hypothetical protein